MVPLQINKFKHQGMKGVRGNVGQGNKGRLEVRMAVDTIPDSQSLSGTGCGEVRLVFGDLNEVFFLISYADAKGRGKMQLVFQNLVDNLKF